MTEQSPDIQAPQRNFLHRRRPEDTAEGCRGLETGNRARAAETPNDHMRSSLERSADAWEARANLLDRLEASFKARAKANVRDGTNSRRGRRSDDG